MSKIGITHSFELPDGRTIELETGKLAKQADGSVVVKMGNTMLLATVVSTKEARPGTDFLPLSVDYRENYAAAGRFPGGFFKREARISNHEILISRLIDRALRPLFPKDYHADTQMLVTLISGDVNDKPDALAGLAACAAICVSDIPFDGPISEVRVAKVDGELIVNPSAEQMENNTLDLIIAASEKDVMMVEGEMKEVSEAEMVEAIKFGHDAIKVQVQAIKDFVAKVEAEKGAIVTREYDHETNDEALAERISKELFDKTYEVAKAQNPNKHERSANFKAVLNEWIDALPEEEKEELDEGLAKKYFHDVEYHAVRKFVLDSKMRIDGRKPDQIRPIWSEVNYLPSAHGSAVFTRGETQSLTSVTLGTKLDMQNIDKVLEQGQSNFILHYNFPAFSTGEARPNRGPGRREIGHGNLAERALQTVISEENPYTVRIVSDILESNGSSSMATVCAGTLAMMDAGVKIKKPVSGIAMGMIADDKGDYAILSDILGDEDHLGDMDFKVCGTKDGITACQMDLKVDGLPYSVMEEALEQAKQGRLHILGEMAKTLTESNADYKPHAPRIVKMTVAKEFIGAIIGPGGKIIQEMQRETGATIVIEEIDGEGHIDIVATSKETIDIVLGRIKAIVAQPEVNEVYEGKVKSIMPFGAFVEFMPGKDGLLHISEIDHKRIESMDGIFKEGEKLQVKLIGIDPKTGKFKLSKKALLPKPEAPAKA